MPKTMIRNDASLNVLLPSDLKRKIKALAWSQGDVNRISSTVRRILVKYFEALEEDWSKNKPEKWAEYEAVLENILTYEKVQAQEKLDKLEAKELAQ